MDKMKYKVDKINKNLTNIKDIIPNFTKKEMTETEKFAIEVIKELEKKFKTACCNQAAQAFLESALIIKHKIEKMSKG